MLPIVPPYLAFMAGATIDDLERVATPTGASCDRDLLRAGPSTVFLILGMAASSLGRALLAYQREMT